MIRGQPYALSCHYPGFDCHSIGCQAPSCLFCPAVSASRAKLSTLQNLLSFHVAQLVPGSSLAPSSRASRGYPSSLPTASEQKYVFNWPKLVPFLLLKSLGKKAQNRSQVVMCLLESQQGKLKYIHFSKWKEKKKKRQKGKVLLPCKFLCCASQATKVRALSLGWHSFWKSRGSRSVLIPGFDLNQPTEAQDWLDVP